MGIYPLPEAIDGHPWQVAEGPGSIDTKARVLHVPLSDDIHSRFIRNHEMAHAAITPKQASGKQCLKHSVSMRALQVCEDLRVHIYLRKCGVEMCGGVTAEEVGPAIKRMAANERELGATLVSTTYTDDHEKVLGHLKMILDAEQLASIAERAALVVRRLESARYLSSPRGLKTATVPAAKLFDVLFPEVGKQSQMPADLLAKYIGGTRHKAGRWGDMTIHSLDMQHSRPLHRLAHRHRFTDEGCVLRAPHRMCVDGRVFCRTMPTPGGTVLIDGSGSMSLSLSDVENIVAAAPASMVAIYSGRKLSGQLTILARNGRVTNRDGLALSRSSGSGNIVDGPALKWLSAQKGPRVWVSDGYVTGVHDNGSIDLGIAAALLCREGDITRVSNPAEALRVLTPIRHR